ncbi:MAG: hypothetical protein F3745_07880 [Nitrospinae bacterium]|nr:hypothetical protein [Nitrospinota bacterium]
MNAPPGADSVELLEKDNEESSLKGTNGTTPEDDLSVLEMDEPLDEPEPSAVESAPTNGENPPLAFSWPISFAESDYEPVDIETDSVAESVKEASTAEEPEESEEPEAPQESEAPEEPETSKDPEASEEPEEPGESEDSM